MIVQYVCVFVQMFKVQERRILPCVKLCSSQNVSCLADMKMLLLLLLVVVVVVVVCVCVCVCVCMSVRPSGATCAEPAFHERMCCLTSTEASRSIRDGDCRL